MGTTKPSLVHLKRNSKPTPLKRKWAEFSLMHDPSVIFHKQWFWEQPAAFSPKMANIGYTINIDAKDVEQAGPVSMATEKDGWRKCLNVYQLKSRRTHTGVENVQRV